MNEHGLIGRPVEEVVATVVDRDDRDPETVREALDPVTDGDVVTGGALESTVSDTSKLVATAETRVELAGIAYEDATATAAPVDDLTVVATRLESYGKRLRSVEDRAAVLGDELPTDGGLDDSETVYDTAVTLREVAAAAQNVARTADDLSFDLERFESWVESPNRRYDEFESDVDLVEESLADLSAAVDELPAESGDPATDWADATMRAHVLTLLATDLRAELTALRRWAAREGGAVRDGLAGRVDSVERQCSELSTRLDRQADPSWRDRFGDDVDAFVDAVAEVEPPVDWAQVEATLDEHRADAFEDH
jgi:hypothetical protein